MVGVVRTVLSSANCAVMPALPVCMIGICNLEYPAFMKWILENMPEKCEVINVGIDIDWLSKHQDMLFPRDSSKAGRWFSIVQHTAQRQYFKKHNKDIMILGRRKADGNYVRAMGTNIYTDSKGVTRYSPLSDWTHEDILAYIHYNKLPLPAYLRLEEWISVRYSSMAGETVDRIAQ